MMYVVVQTCFVPNTFTAFKLRHQPRIATVWTFVVTLVCTYLSPSAVQATVSSYSAGSCSPSKLQGRQIYGVGCALKVTDAYYASADTDYYRLALAVLRSKYVVCCVVWLALTFWMLIAVTLRI
jgi:hypothetical protein